MALIITELEEHRQVSLLGRESVEKFFGLIDGPRWTDTDFSYPTYKLNYTIGNDVLGYHVLDFACIGGKQQHLELPTWSDIANQINHRAVCVKAHFDEQYQLILREGVGAMLDGWIPEFIEVSYEGFYAYVTK